MLKKGVSGKRKPIWKKYIMIIDINIFKFIVSVIFF